MNQYQNVEKIFEDFRPYLDSYWVYVVGIILGILTAIRSYMGGSECPSNQRIDGKIVLITGASSGIGKETAIELGRRGGRIILAVKNTVSGNKVAEKIRSISNGKAEVKCVDLSSLKSVQNLVKNLGHFLLTQLLLPKLKKSDQGRIINLSARAHMLSSINLDDLNQEQKFTARGAFAQSKLALVLMTIYMSSLLKDNTKITINAVDPGLVRGTGNTRRSPISSTYLMKTIMQPWMWLLLKNPVEGAQTSIYLAVSPDLVNQTGKYFSDCELKTPSENAENDYLSKELYEKSMALIQPYMSLKNSNLSS
ncbi:retinol dehydrogenase 13-like isoform X4 [Belonocnema kinseyi]|uniref:retinol dehydrogenase 13-like isoform X4 n=1 Tax=Belonocnema kinseyi TaxID=2817044 RepID=UPI00143D0B1E|nr:retinol dehydrogenase 13-like isoform X4 [Belonocnema kinseyi]